MNEYLIFSYIAPMAAFGAYAGHERRGSDNKPKRSAIIGLIGAALGIERNDRDAQLALRQYRIAYQGLTENIHLRDYHTVQTVHQRKSKRPISRRSALEDSELKVATTVTYRDYRTDVAFAIAIWLEGDAWPLTYVANSLRNPKFMLYAGRKSCPFSAPLAPDIVYMSDPLSAVRTVRVPDWLPNEPQGPIICDPFNHGHPDRIETDSVEPIDRDLWHFTQSRVWYFDQIVDS